MTQQPRGPTPIEGFTSELDITPLGWKLPQPADVQQVVQVILDIFGQDGAAYTLSVWRVTVTVQRYQEIPPSNIEERRRMATRRLYAVQEQRVRADLLERDDDGKAYDKARKETVDRASRAMQAVGQNLQRTDFHAAMQEAFAGASRNMLEVPDLMSKTSCVCSHGAHLHTTAALSGLAGGSCAGTVGKLALKCPCVKFAEKATS